tara:strand:+ start:656 stop:1126 length:471 start_codon:yes stop_codon:yes gene_type:complete
MLALISGDTCLIFGLILLVLPIVAVELSRPRDAVWGAVVILLGLVLITSRDNLRGAPMLAVLLGSMLISRLSIEICQSRWFALSDQEQQKLGSLDHWLTSLHKIIFIIESLWKGLAQTVKQLKPTGKSGVLNKKWVREGNGTSPTTKLIRGEPGED